MPPHTAARNASFSLPPAAFAAFFVSSSGTLIVSKLTERERSVITGLCGVVAGARIRPADAASSTIERRFAAGRRTARVADPTARRAMPSWRRRSWRRASNVRPQGEGCSASAAAGVWPGSSGSRSRSNSTIASLIAPTPSVIEWWSFWMTAALPSASPSTTVNSQSGRARSKLCIPIGSARSSSARRSPGAGARTRRRW